MDIKKILIVEDNPDLIDIYTHMLEKGGFAVLQAHNGAEGTTMAQEQKPDLILLDILMPEMTGFEVLAVLKNSEKTKAIPIFMITNLSSPQEMAKAKKLGADKYLIKTDITLEYITKHIKEIQN
jgi:CheY-like chemotaxis protein